METRQTGLAQGLSGLGFLLAAGLVVAALILSSTLRDIRTQGQEITVKGFAERPIESDRVVWSAWFITRGGQLQAAQGKMAGDLQLVRRFLTEGGTAPAELNLAPLRMNPVYRIDANGRSTNEVEGFVLTQAFEVSSTDLDRIERLARASSELLEQGVELSSSPPQYFFTALDALKIEMLGEASRDAVRRAEVLAENSGGRVGDLRSASQGVFQVTPAFSTEVSGYGMNDTSSRMKSIKAVVTMRYAIEG